MALPNVNITQGNGNLGAVIPSADGVAALVLTGVAPAGYNLGDELVFNSISEAEEAGFDAAYDVANTVLVYEHIKSFFDQAGNGAELHFVMYGQAITIDELVLKTNAYAKQILSDNKGNIKLLAVAVNPEGGYVPVYTNGIDTKVEAAIVNAQALYDDEFAAYRPVSIFIEGRGFQGDPAAVVDLRQNAANRVSIALLAKPEVSALAYGTDYASVGTILGKAALVPVQRNIGRVKDGALAGSWGLSGNNSVDAMTEAQLASLHDKGYIFAYITPGVNGYIINDDPTCSPIIDDYSSLARGRVMDKASRLVRTVYVNELKDEVDVNPDTGRLAPGAIKYLQALAEDAINKSMTSAEEIAGVNVVIDPTQDVLGTNNIAITIDITPKGYSKNISATLNYQNPNA